jgi:hypothetical protein
MFIEANNTELGHSFGSAMFRAPGDKKMLAPVGSDQQTTTSHTIQIGDSN